MRRAKPIHFAWSYDEEVSCLGGMELAEYARDHDVRAEGCIIGEPTGMTVVIAHKGTSHFWVRVRGKAAHSSFALTGESCNAIDYATKLITKLREIAEEYRRNGTRHDFQVPFSTLSTKPHQWRQRLEHRARGVRSSSSSFERFPTRLSPR
ncbi:putative glutamamyl carboxypeptidase [Trypanosoma cruzi]|uniref:Putative glutamamyl carboxypeptidase n=1 Tax=Trypanosoma cruzi TaxID=5693 RepID=A0A2V2UG26_TRYCR|nr:putative glutamamyl carboxypeptidase [Trypanosoma cruzi]